MRRSGSSRPQFVLELAGPGLLHEHDDDRRARVLEHREEDLVVCEVRHGGGLRDANAGEEGFGVPGRRRDAEVDTSYQSQPSHTREPLPIGTMNAATLSPVRSLGFASEGNVDFDRAKIAGFQATVAGPNSIGVPAVFSPSSGPREVDAANG